MKRLLLCVSCIAAGEGELPLSAEVWERMGPGLGMKWHCRGWEKQDIFLARWWKAL